MAERAALFRPTHWQVKAVLCIDNEGEPQLLLDPNMPLARPPIAKGLRAVAFIKQRNYPARDEA